MKFGLVLGRLAVLNISDRAVLYATFDGKPVIFSWTIFFSSSVAYPLKSCLTLR